MSIDAEKVDSDSGVIATPSPPEQQQQQEKEAAKEAFIFTATDAAAPKRFRKRRAVAAKMPPVTSGWLSSDILENTRNNSDEGDANVFTIDRPITFHIGSKDDKKLSGPPHCIYCCYCVLPQHCAIRCTRRRNAEIASAIRGLPIPLQRYLSLMKKLPPSLTIRAKDGK